METTRQMPSPLATSRDCSRKLWTWWLADQGHVRLIRVAPRTRPLQLGEVPDLARDVQCSADWPMLDKLPCKLGEGLNSMSSAITGPSYPRGCFASTRSAVSNWLNSSVLFFEGIKTMSNQACVRQSTTVASADVQASFGPALTRLVTDSS